MCGHPHNDRRNGGFTLTVVLLALVTAAGAASAQANQAVDTLFARWDHPGSPGCALGVVRDGELVYGRGYGLADVEQGVPLTTRSIFYLASVSKQFTAATMALLALQGRIAIDDDIRRYFPELPDYGTPVTIRNMIHHTSGLRDYLTLMELADMSLEESYQPAQILALVTRQEALNFAPGTQYLYSNTGYFLMPLIVQRVTGRSIKEFAEANIFGPLGMEHTHFHDDYRHEVADRAYSYRQTGGDFERSFLPKFDQVGSGGVLSTVEDLVKWDANFYDPRVGGPEFLELMHARGVLAAGDTLPYAFGLRLSEYKGQVTEDHGGSMMGFKTHLLRFPERHFSVICLCNLGSINPGQLAYRVADVYLVEEFAAHLRQFAGKYYSRELGVTWSLSIDGSDLRLDRAGERQRTLEPLGGDAFRSGTADEIHFLRDASGAVSGFRFDSGRVLGLEFERADGPR